MSITHPAAFGAGVISFLSPCVLPLVPGYLTIVTGVGSTAQEQDVVALADFAGRPTVVNFFASWCTACDAELPAFVAVSGQVAGHDRRPVRHRADHVMTTVRLAEICAVLAIESGDAGATDPQRGVAPNTFHG